MPDIHEPADLAQQQSLGLPHGNGSDFATRGCLQPDRGISPDWPQPPVKRPIPEPSLEGFVHERDPLDPEADLPDHDGLPASQTRRANASAREPLAGAATLVLTLLAVSVVGSLPFYLMTMGNDRRRNGDGCCK